MTPLALGLVLGAACCHAVWNLLLKRVVAGPVFVWLFLAAAVVIWLPAAAIDAAVERPHIGGAQLGFMAGSGALHLGYFLLLQRGYRSGDLSVVYPLARGTGPVLATIGAIIVLGERPSALALAGAALVGAGVLSLARGPMRSAAAVYALATGVLIAVYTLWDKHGVDALAVPPLVYDWGSNLVRTAAFAPVALRRRDELRALWRAHRRTVLAVAILSPLAYVLVLGALTFTRASYIAPAREVSIAIGAVLGVRLLGEADAKRRLAAAAVIVGGLVALALG